MKEILDYILQIVIIKLKLVKINFLFNYFSIVLKQGYEKQIIGFIVLNCKKI